MFSKHSDITLSKVHLSLQFEKLRAHKHCYSLQILPSQIPVGAYHFSFTGVPSTVGSCHNLTNATQSSKLPSTISMTAEMWVVFGTLFWLECPFCNTSFIEQRMISSKMFLGNAKTQLCLMSILVSSQLFCNVFVMALYRFVFIQTQYCFLIL